MQLLWCLMLHQFSQWQAKPGESGGEEITGFVQFLPEESATDEEGNAAT